MAPSRAATDVAAAATSRACAPPPGRAYLCVGQDEAAIAEYARENGGRRGRPRAAAAAAAMSYTDLATLRGLAAPADYGSGVESAAGAIAAVEEPFRWAAAARRDGEVSRHQPRHHPRDGNDDEDVEDDNDQTSADDAPKTALQLGLWLNGTRGCRDVVAGRLDGNIHTLLDYLTNRLGGGGGDQIRTFLRIGYEFDNPIFGYLDDPAAYRAAFRRVAVHCRHRVPGCATRVALVWHSWAASDVDLAAFYPGDDVVDWFGLSLFRQPLVALKAQVGGGGGGGGDGDDAGGNGTVARRRDSDTDADLGPHVRRVLAFARQRGRKPVMVAESTPFGGIDRLADPWADWFRPVLRLVADPANRIGMLCYISGDWDARPMWRGVGFGDARLTTNATVGALWRLRVVENPNFLRRLVCGGDSDGVGPETPWLALARRATGPAAASPLGSVGVAALLLGVLLALVTASARHSRRRHGPRQGRATATTSVYGSIGAAS